MPPSIAELDPTSRSSEIERLLRSGAQVLSAPEHEQRIADFSASSIDEILANYTERRTIGDTDAERGPDADGVRRLLPTISRVFERDGMQLERHYAYMFCAPSRQSLLSGRWPVNCNEVNTACRGVPLQMATMAYYFMSFIPGGTRGVKIFLMMIVRTIKSFVTQCIPMVTRCCLCMVRSLTS